MILLIGLYLDPTSARCREFMECVKRNAAIAAIEQVRIFFEGPDSLNRLQSLFPELGLPKVKLVHHGRRVTCHDLFSYANRHLSGQRVIVANADIFFDDTLSSLDDYDLTGKLLCLSRWDVGPDGESRFFDHPMSQDAWIFAAPIIAFPCDFPLGVPGCDNRLAWEAQQAGLTVLNPGRSIRAHHLHLSQVRRYSERQRLPGRVLPVPAMFLEETSCPGPAGKAVDEIFNTEIAVMTEPMFALTSLSPSPQRAAVQRQCIQSWQDAGLQVRSFNYRSEIASLASLSGVEFIAVEEPASGPDDSPRNLYVPIKVMLDWAVAQDVYVLIINADIELRLLPWELKRAQWLSDGGLCYFVRYNHDGEIAHARREPYGIDAFMLHGRHAALFPDSSFSMGQPFWDYWLPYNVAENRNEIYSIEDPVAFHRSHPQQWSWESWHRCALEFDRITGALHGDRSLEACVAMAARTRQRFDRQRKVLTRRPRDIKHWVRQTFSTRTPKTFLELGAHTGSDTAWMAALPCTTIHAFEPDPRNCPPTLPNVTLHRAAIADRDGTSRFIMSDRGWGQTWTHSSSIRLPKNHLTRYPVTFGDVIEVPTVALDTFSRQNGFGVIDFIWADIQGAEADMIRGGKETLARTRYLYTEYSDDEMYEGQATLREILNLLPNFRVVDLWPDDVLLENRTFSCA